MIRKFLPESFQHFLFGNRTKHGLAPDLKDPDWLDWVQQSVEIYSKVQKSNIGLLINNLGYKAIFREIELDGKKVLEIGSGDLSHIEFWNSSPVSYTAVDIDPEFLKMTAQKIKCSFHPVLLQDRNQTLPFPNSTFDIVLSFYSLEHLYPLKFHLKEINRVLKNDGFLAGAIPNEGGFSWALGRTLTSKRWVRKNTSIEYDKIICWEHPNFADDILFELNRIFSVVKKRYSPLNFLPSLDLNLVTSFIAFKKDTHR